jgi:enoyl-CoA hydratase
MEKCVLIEKKGRIAYLILNRPEVLNALNQALFNDLELALDDLEADDGVSVIIIKGAGRAFCVGYDVSKYTKQTVMEDRNKLENYTRTWLRVWEFPKPIIAQVHGYALAGGTQLLGSCDIVVTAKNATFGFPQLPLGGGFVALYWPWHIGYQRTKLLDLTAGSRITGEQAVQYGMAAVSFDEEALEEETLRIARAIAKTPLDILVIKKKAHNRIMEMQGFRQAVLLGPDQDAIIHTSDGIKLVRQMISELGLKGAIKWFNEQEV